MTRIIVIKITSTIVLVYYMLMIHLNIGYTLLYIILKNLKSFHWQEVQRSLI